MRVRVSSIGLYVSSNVETSADLASRVGKTAEWIERTVGVRSRHIADCSMEEQGARAASAAIGDGPPPDLIINASLSPRQLIPDTSVFISQAMGYDGIPSFSIHATCLSFMVAYRNAAALLDTGSYDRILIVSSEAGSVCRDFSEPESAVLIGDGAAAVVMEKTPNDEHSEMLGFHMITRPAGSAFTELRGCGLYRHPNDPNTKPTDNLFHMDGRRVYRMGRKMVGEVLEAVFAKTKTTVDDVDLVIAHQASGPALTSLRYYGIDKAKVVDTFTDYGNCIAASIPMTLAIANEQGRLKRGDRVLLLGVGAGLSAAAALIQW